MTHRTPSHPIGRALLATLALAMACGGSGDRSGDNAGAASTTPTPAVTPPAVAPAAGDSAAATTATGPFLDPERASREQLVALPGMTPGAADALVAGRPYADMRAVDRALAASLPDSAARRTLYARLWKPLDLNTATGEEIRLIPGVGRRMAHEFEEYRPYRDMARFRREIRKYVDSAEVERLARYVTIR